MRYNHDYMTIGVKVLLALFTFHFSWFSSYAQNDPEFRMEIGGGLALAAYEGDFNSSVVKGMQPMGAVVAKYKMNPRMAWSAQIGIGKLKGSSKDVETWYPLLWEKPVDFSTSLTEFTVRYEYNFWPFGTGKEYLGAKPLTSFIAIGAGLAFAGKPKLTQASAAIGTELALPDAAGTDFVMTEPEAAVAFQMPIGIGVKYKLRDRLNLTAEWMMHFTGSDKLDGVKDPYGIKSDGLFKNTDCYSTLQLSLTYDIWAKCKTCHNDRE
jgi:hypothetical protein